MSDVTRLHRACNAVHPSPHHPDVTCTRIPGHQGDHRAPDGETLRRWVNPEVGPAPEPLAAPPYRGIRHGFHVDPPPDLLEPLDGELYAEARPYDRPLALLLWALLFVVATGWPLLLAWIAVTA